MADTKAMIEKIRSAEARKHPRKDGRTFQRHSSALRSVSVQLPPTMFIPPKTCEMSGDDSTNRLWDIAPSSFQYLRAVVNIVYTP